MLYSNTSTYRVLDAGRTIEHDFATLWQIHKSLKSMTLCIIKFNIKLIVEVLLLMMK